eukprot:5144929-Prymnesium_polylepis.1
MVVCSLLQSTKQDSPACQGSKSVGKVRCLLRAWDAEVQRETVHEASRVFKDVQKAGVGCAPPTDEIEESNP